MVWPKGTLKTWPKIHNPSLIKNSRCFSTWELKSLPNEVDLWSNIIAMELPSSRIYHRCYGSSMAIMLDHRSTAVIMGRRPCRQELEELCVNYWTPDLCLNRAGNTKTQEIQAPADSVSKTSETDILDNFKEICHKMGLPISSSPSQPSHVYI